MAPLVWPFVCLCNCLSVRPFVCPSVCLSMTARLAPTGRFRWPFGAPSWLSYLIACLRALLPLAQMSRFDKQRQKRRRRHHRAPEGLAGARIVVAAALQPKLALKLQLQVKSMRTSEIEMQMFARSTSGRLAAARATSF